VGTPGRLRQLMEAADSRVDACMLRILVYDEADSLMSPLFDADIAAIHACLPARKQVSVCLAPHTSAGLGSHSSGLSSSAPASGSDHNRPLPGVALEMCFLSQAERTLTKEEEGRHGR
jgi:hypothetical protein